MQPSFNCVVFTFTRKSSTHSHTQWNEHLGILLLKQIEIMISNVLVFTVKYTTYQFPPACTCTSQNLKLLFSINYQYSTTSRPLIPMQQTVAARQYSIWIHLDYPPFDIDPLFSCLCVSAEGTSYFFTSVTEYFHSQHQLIISKINSVCQY